MRRNILLLLFAGLLVISLSGCGSGGGEQSGAGSQQAPAQSEAGTDISAFTSGIQGSVRFVGAAPDRKRIKQDQECTALHSNEVVLSEDVIVNDNGTLKYVFVYVKEGLGDRKFNPPAQPVIFDQKGCMYTPHVFGVQTGQTLKILNSDPLLHNIHAMPEVNRPFNFGMPKQGDERERKFDKAEVMVKIKCDVHPWMLAYCGVVSHPYYSVTGDDGSFSLKHLPPGQYLIEAWHEKYGTQAQSITVGDNEVKNIEFTFQEKSAS